MERKTTLTIEDHLDGDRILIRTAYWDGIYKSYKKVLIDNIGPRIIEDNTAEALGMLCFTGDITKLQTYKALDYFSNKGPCPKWLSHVVHQTANPDSASSA